MLVIIQRTTAGGSYNTKTKVTENRLLKTYALTMVLPGLVDL